MGTGSERADMIAAAETAEEGNRRMLRGFEEDVVQGRQLLTGLIAGYGWCSMSIGKITGGTDHQDYCNSKSYEAWHGRGSRLSNCCREHDTCLHSSRDTIKGGDWGGK